MYSVENMWGFFFLRSYGAGRRRNVHYERIFFEEKRKRKSFAASTKSLVAAWGLCVTQRVGSLPIFLLDIYLRYVRTPVGVNNIVDCCWFLQSLFLHRHRGDMCYMEQKKKRGREKERERGNGRPMMIYKNDCKGEMNPREGSTGKAPSILSFPWSSSSSSLLWLRTKEAPHMSCATTKAQLSLPFFQLTSSFSVSFASSPEKRIKRNVKRRGNKEGANGRENIYKNKPWLNAHTLSTIPHNSFPCRFMRQCVQLLPSVRPSARPSARRSLLVTVQLHTA